MTAAEATALIIREGWPDDTAREDAMYMMLHFGFDPDVEEGQIARLTKAINTAREATDGPIDRQLAGSLWLLGVEASTALGTKWSAPYRNSIMALLNAVEAFFMNEKPVDNMRQ